MLGSPAMSANALSASPQIPPLSQSFSTVLTRSSNNTPACFHTGRPNISSKSPFILLESYDRTWSWCTPRTRFQSIAGRVWFAESLVLSVPLCTQRADREILRPLVVGAPACSEEWRCSCFNSCRTPLLLQPQSGSVQGFKNWCALTHSDTLHIGVLAYTVSLCDNGDILIIATRKLIHDNNKFNLWPR